MKIILCTACILANYRPQFFPEILFEIFQFIRRLFTKCVCHQIENTFSNITWNYPILSKEYQGVLIIVSPFESLTFSVLTLNPKKHFESPILLYKYIVFFVDVQIFLCSLCFGHLETTVFSLDPLWDFSIDMKTLQNVPGAK